MSSSILMVSLAFVLLCLVAFVGYYGYRLMKASRHAQETTSRFEEFVRRQAVLEAKTAAPAREMPATDVPATEIPEAPAPASDLSGKSIGVSTTVRVHDQKLPLRQLSPEAIFMRRDSGGEVTVQIAERRPLPLKYVLDPRVNHILSQVAMRATADLGAMWSILAEEDAEGRLQITRLS
jgi:hypothetical protein